MFVSRSKYDKAILERNHEKACFVRLQVDHLELRRKWNDVMQKINAKGGEEFLLFGKLEGKVNTVHQFTDDELRSLLQLVHPDKHGGKESAVRLTQKINALREK